MGWEEVLATSAPPPPCIDPFSTLPPGTQALYLIDCVKRGIPLPPQLPAGQFPPVAGTVSLSHMMVGASQHCRAGLGPGAALA